MLTQETIKKIPTERLLIETDSPYLAPHPYRGKQNEPALIIHTLKALALLKETDIQKIEEQTTDNFFKLFKKESRA